MSFSNWTTLVYGPAAERGSAKKKPSLRCQGNRGELRPQEEKYELRFSTIVEVEGN
jgi:hypothetical protein